MAARRGIGKDRGNRECPGSRHTSHAAVLRADGALGQGRPGALGSRSRRKAAWRAHSRKAIPRARTGATVGSIRACTAQSSATTARPAVSAVAHAIGPVSPPIGSATNAAGKNRASISRNRTTAPPSTGSNPSGANSSRAQFLQGPTSTTAPSLYGTRRHRRAAIRAYVAVPRESAHHPCLGFTVSRETANPTTPCRNPDFKPVRRRPVRRPVSTSPGWPWSSPLAQR
jgi:hypothetical protein